MNESINLKIGMEVSQGGLFGITVAIFEFPPQSQVMGQNVVTWPPLYEPRKSTKFFFHFFSFFWWNMTFGYLNRTKNINSNFHCYFFTSFRLFELHWSFSLIFLHRNSCNSLCPLFAHLHFRKACERLFTSSISILVRFFFIKVDISYLLTCFTYLSYYCTWIK